MESSPSRNFLIANESTKTMIVKKSKAGFRSKCLLKPVSKGGRNSSLHTFSLYGLTSNASGKKLLAESSRQQLERMADINTFMPGTATNKFYDKHVIQALDRFT